ncbi:MAG: restriction endonuclease [Sporichthyaceae bacterium]
MNSEAGLFGEVDDFSAPDSADVLPGTPAWLQFEQDVRENIAARFTDVTVSHNQKQAGRLSQRQRQIDVLITGSVAGHSTTIVVECKRNASRAVGIGVVDAFVGKLLDLETDIGVLWAFGGFDAGAIARANGARHPRIDLRSPADFLEHRGIPDEFFNALDCPNENCWGGEINWFKQTGEDSKLELDVGYCGSCGTFAGRCNDSECEDITALDGGDVSCYGYCGATWSVTNWPDGGTSVDWQRASDG